MKVGVIGSKSSCEVVKKSIKEIDSSVEVAAYEEEQVNRSDRLIEECEQECDAVLLRAVRSKVLWGETIISPGHMCRWKNR